MYLKVAMDIAGAADCTCLFCRVPLIELAPYKRNIE